MSDIFVVMKEMRKNVRRATVIEVDHEIITGESDSRSGQEVLQVQLLLEICTSKQLVAR